MRKLTKVLSLVLSMGLILGTVPMIHVSAETTSGTLETIGGLTFSNTSPGKAMVVCGDAYKGNGVLKVTAESWGGLLNSDFSIPVDNTDTYAVEAYMKPMSKGEETEHLWFGLAYNQRAYLRWDGTSLTDTTKNYSVEKVGTDGWYKISTIHQRETNQEGSPFLITVDYHRSNTNTEESEPTATPTPNNICMYMDEIKVINLTQGTYSYYDFEEEHYNKAKNLMATQVEANKVSISWMNPSVPAPTQATLYDISDGGSGTLLTSVTPIAGGINEYIQEGVAANSTKVYRLDFTYTSGKINSQTVGCKTVASMPALYTTVGDWTLLNAFTPKSPAKMNLDDEVYKTAAPSLHVISNDTTYDTSSTYLQLKTPSTVSAGNYRLSYYVKMNNAKYIWGYTFDKNEDLFRTYPTSNWGEDNINNVADWTLITRDYTLSADAVETNVMRFVLLGYAEDFWIDDVSLIALDASGNPIGDNLLTDGSGDLSVADPAPEALTGVTAQATENVDEVIVNWTLPSADETVIPEYVVIYDRARGDYPLAYVPASLETVTLKNLEGGVVSHLAVSPVNSQGRQGTAVNKDVTAEAEETVAVPEQAWILEDYVVVTYDDQATVCVRIENNSEQANTSAQLLLAAYLDEKMAVFDLTDSKDISPENASEGVVLCKTITVPAGATLKAFLWDSVKGRNAWKKGEILSVN